MVTAAELDPEIAAAYQHFFPQDKVIVADAHQYLLDHYKEFDFIWSSPPCPTHSKIRFMAVKNGEHPEVYPDMNLYQEVIFLQHHFEGKWVVENVQGYYEPLIKPQVLGRHYFWANFIIATLKVPENDGHSLTIEQLQKHKGFSLEGLKIKHRHDQVLRNVVLPKVGLHIFDCAFKEKQKQLCEVTTDGDFI